MFNCARQVGYYCQKQGYTRIIGGRFSNRRLLPTWKYWMSVTGDDVLPDESDFDSGGDV